MGRKADPRGKDRPRTIVLSGDVADIAQDLADKSQLSKVLSQLLRQAYNISDEVSIMKAKLLEMTDRRKAMQEAEEEMIAAIRDAEDRIIHERSHILPSLYQRQGKLEEKLERLRRERELALDPTTSKRKVNQMQATRDQLQEVLDEIERLEADE